MIMDNTRPEYNIQDMPDGDIMIILESLEPQRATELFPTERTSAVLRTL